MNKTIRTLTPRPLNLRLSRSQATTLGAVVSALAVACGGPEGTLGDEASNLSFGPTVPTNSARAYLDCRPVFDHIDEFSSAANIFTDVTVDYVGNAGAGMYEFTKFPDNLSVLTNGALIIEDGVLGGVLYDSFDLTVSGIRPTTAAYTMLRKPKVTQGLGGVQTLPGIIGPEGESNATRCYIARSTVASIPHTAVMTFNVPGDDGVFTLTVSFWHLDG